MPTEGNDIAASIRASSHMASLLLLLARQRGSSPYYWASYRDSPGQSDEHSLGDIRASGFWNHR